MQTYCSGCKNHADNICSTKIIMMANIEVKGCAICMTNKLYSDKTNHKTELEIIMSQFLIY